MREIDSSSRERHSDGVKSDPPELMTQSLPPPPMMVAGASVAAPAAPTGSWITVFVKNLAAQDWFITLYFGILMIALVNGSGPGRPECIRKVAIDFGCFFVGLLLTRGGVIPHRSFANGMVYRFALFLSVFLSYFQLREILPAVSLRAVDAQILDFDLRVFGVEPSLAWDKYVTPATTEWFSFFYFGYFFVLSAHILPMMFNGKNPDRLAHFSLGIFMVFGIGHLVYMLVPGFGPYKYLGPRFEHELSGGLFWGLVRATVDAGGAQKDIFPSLHTAVPTFFLLFSIRYRQHLPFKYTWPPLLFAVTQIICATMFLRWHYLVDIFAGLTLATLSVLLSGKIVAWEKQRRERWNIPPTFTVLEYPWPKRDE